jgi:hypothetical protein
VTPWSKSLTYNMEDNGMLHFPFALLYCLKRFLLITHRFLRSLQPGNFSRFEPIVRSRHVRTQAQAVLTIELQVNSIWDFGPVTWQNVIIEAATNSSDWCTNKQTGFYGSNVKFNWTKTEPMITTSGVSTMFRWDTVMLNGP